MSDFEFTQTMYVFGHSNTIVNSLAGEDSCNGDSGGPLIARRDRKSSMFLWGIVSSGTRVCGSGKPGIYTRISHYGDWIKANLRP